WIPPVYKNHSTSSVGYSPFDHYDLGDKYQKSNTSTRVGKKDELLRMIGVMHANGIEVIQDIVLNHIDNAGGPLGEGGQDLEATYSTSSSGGYKNFRYSSFATPEGFTGTVDADDYLAKRGRWPKNYPNFHPHAGHNATTGNWEDPLFGPDICFGYLEDGTGNGYGQSSTCVDGVDGCYNPAQSSGYMRNNARDWLNWFVRQTGVDGFRWDAVKHYPHFIVQDLSYNVKYNNGWASLGEEMFNVGEYVGGKSDLDGYVNSVTGSNGGSDELLGTFDFSLRGAVYGMVSGGGFYNMSLIPGEQQDERVHFYAGSNTYVNRTVPFVNNHDTFRPQFDASGNYTGWNTSDELAAHIDPFEVRLSAAYAVIFAVDGSPQVFFEDLFNVGGKSNRWTHLPFDETDLEVREDIANIIWCHQNLGFKDGVYKVRTSANGEFTPNSNPDFGSEADHLIIDRSGKALIGINDNGVNTQYNFVKTDFAPGTLLKDYSGHFADSRAVNGDGWFEVWTPAAKDYGNGRYGGYSVWAPAGQDASNYSPGRSVITTHEWEMSDDLGDSHCNSLGQGGALPSGSTVDRLVGKFYSDAGTAVTYVVTPDDNSQDIVIDFYDLSGNLLHTDESTGTITGSFAISQSGWVSAKIHNKSTNETGQNCTVRISYQAPDNLDIDIARPENLVAIWTGRVNDDWNECSNWEAGIIPDENMDAIFFTHNDKNFPTVTGTLNVRNVMVNDGTSLSIDPGSQLNVHGNWIQNSSLPIDGKVSFSGTSVQTISGNPQFNDLVIDNASGVSLSSDISIADNGSLTFSDGNIILNNQSVTIGELASVTGYSETAYFQTANDESSGGFLIRSVETTPVIFPVGTIDGYTPLTIVNTGTSSNFQVRVFNDIYENGTTGDVVTGISNWVRKTWEITPTTSGVNANITFQWNASEEGEDFINGNAIVQKNIGGAGEGWNEVVSGTVSGSNPYLITATDVSTFSKFGILGDATLPVALTRFVGKAQNNSEAVLHWETSSESDNSGFSIEKSADGGTYSEVGFAVGKGSTTSVSEYSFT
ncbi:MAG: alpha-amylase domain-containing protein, partial [Cyclobacteriaceae bacterium]